MDKDAGFPEMNQNEKDFLYFYMQQSWEEMRHLENLREKVTILVVTISSAITGFVIQQKFSFETLPFIFAVIVLGIFGLLMTLKLFQLHRKNQDRLDKWYKYIETFCGDNPQILELKNQADIENTERFYCLAEMRHNSFWSFIHGFIVTMGLILLIIYPFEQTHVNNANQGYLLKTGDTIIVVKDIFVGSK